jgi:hypothetical protein
MQMARSLEGPVDSSDFRIVEGALLELGLLEDDYEGLGRR